MVDKLKFSTTVNSEVNTELYQELVNLSPSSRPGKMQSLAVIGLMYLQGRMENIVASPLSIPRPEAGNDENDIDDGFLESLDDLNKSGFSEL